MSKENKENDKKRKKPIPKCSFVDCKNHFNNSDSLKMHFFPTNIDR